MMFSKAFMPLLVSLATAAPHNFTRRSGGNPPGGAIQCFGGPPCVTAAPTGDECIISQVTTGEDAHAWKVGIPGDTLSNYGTGSSTLGGGLLDNLRGQCGVITDWKAAANGNNNLVATFSTTIFCTAQKVNDAIWLTNGMHYEGNCGYSPVDNGAEGGPIFIEVLQGVFDSIPH